MARRLHVALLAALLGACSSARNTAPGVTVTSDAALPTTPADAGLDVDGLSGEDNAEADYLALPRLTPCPSGEAVPAALRLVTWNMKAARDAPLERIAQEIAAMNPDAIALQEVDVSVRRTGELDEPRRLGALLGYDYTFAAALYWDGGVYGLALLSRLPFARVERHRLDLTGSSEPRIALDVTLCHAGRRLRLIDVHADIEPDAATLQLTQAAELARPDAQGRVVLLGDFNQTPGEPGPAAALAVGLVDLFAGDERPTFSDRRLDHVFAGAELARAFTSRDVWQTDASDHAALVVDFAP
jgi:endonuclease/exonuclease/phosphatase family metal-dependent hydrolase